MRLIAAFFLLLLYSAAPLASQDPREIPERPVLPEGADPNDAAAYFDYGVELLDDNPRAAADAFYWASRIAPAWADPLYARRIALLMSDPYRLSRYIEGYERTIESPEVQAIDSLQYRALMLDPYLYRQFDRQLFKKYLEWSYRQELRRIDPGAYVNPGLLDYWIENYLRQGSSYMRAWAHYGTRNFPDALRNYARALRRSRNKSDIHADRARIFYLIGNYDSAHVEMTNALEQMRNRDEKDLVFLYESKALYEHSIGMALQQKGDLDGAREAYARALQEDLSYYPAHLNTALIALAAGDTAAAVSSFDLAVQVKPDAPALRYRYGLVLLKRGRVEEGVAQLRRAIEIEPYYADPYYALALALEMIGDPAAAVEQYRLFLDHAIRGHPRRGFAEERVAALGTAGVTAGNP